MGLKFEDYRNHIGQSYWDNILGKLRDDIEDTYGEYNFFYAKNALNDEKDELYFFYDSELIVVSFNERYSEYYLTEYCFEKSKLKINNNEDFNTPIVLELYLKSNDKFVFNSHADSNKHWIGKYRNSVIQLFKIL